MKFEKCLKFLMELNKFDNVYVTIECENKDGFEEYLLDDLTVNDLHYFTGINFDISFDGVNEDGDPIFKLLEK